jgi:hypothetical protein
VIALVGSAQAFAQQPNPSLPEAAKADAEPVAAGATSTTTTGLPRLGQEPGEPGARSAQPQTPLGAPSQSQQNVLDFHG